MEPRAALSDLRVLASRPIARRAAVLASSTLVQRILAPALAWTLVERSVRDKVAVSLLFGTLFTARTLVQRIFTSRTESELLELTAASVLHGDVLRAEVLPDQDMHLEATQGVYHSAQLLSQTVPNAGGDATAASARRPERTDAWRSRVAFLPQRPYLPPRADVRRAVGWPLSGATDERMLGRRCLARPGARSRRRESRLLCRVACRPRAPLLARARGSLAPGGADDALEALGIAARRITAPRAPRAPTRSHRTARPALRDRRSTWQ